MFRRLIVKFMIGGRAVFEDMSRIGSAGETDALAIYFNSVGYESDRSTLRHFRDCLPIAGIDWLYERSGRWIFDPGVFKTTLPDFMLPEWLTRKVPIALEVVQYDVRIRIEKSEMQSIGPVFLSHKSADKPLVQDIATALELIGVSFWIDERALSAGSHLERSLSSAIKEVKAAAFIITLFFEDRGYLASEVDYAIREKRARDDFLIITIRIDGHQTEIPELLKSYVWKDVSNGLQALIEILRTLKDR